MIKKEEVISKEINNIYYCDDCGRKIGDHLRGVNRCDQCGAHMCSQCVAKIINDFGDYPDGLCKMCEPIYNEYENKIEELDIQIDNLWDECKKKCKEKRNDNV